MKLVPGGPALSSAGPKKSKRNTVLYKRVLWMPATKGLGTGDQATADWQLAEVPSPQTESPDPHDYFTLTVIT
jgi:hypothetical protein